METGARSRDNSALAPVADLGIFRGGDFKNPSERVLRGLGLQEEKFERL